ncbi:MAG: FtsW/RodA/SpoVE family cell cycle protein [Bacteroidales bacterium]|nr:FtsW/RodA/SpoVE family cell cycle protein [Bacteroidales bacterium]MBR2607650.1 FtsW/RodA/SpoVE family cell cycle protein [Bacteroidaceae bacterium]
MGKGITNRLFKGDKVIWIIFTLLFALSFIEVFSATSTLAYKNDSYWQPITQHVTFMMLGVATTWIVHNMPMTWFKKLSYAAYWVGIGFLLWAMFAGVSLNGESRWVPFLGFTIQASEVAKLGIVMIVARILGDGQTSEGAGHDVMKKILYAVGLACVFIFKGNLSTVILICFTTYLMLFIGKIPRVQMWKLTGACVVAGTVALGAIMLTPESLVVHTPLKRMVTWKKRIIRSIDPVSAEKDQSGGNDQRMHANIAIASSNVIFGKGPGNSEQRDFLPMAFSDFIYAIIIEELGLIIGGLGVILLYLILLYHTGQIAKDCDDPYASFLIIGAALMIVIQAMAHMSISVGMGPVTGQPLPFVSLGGSSLVINCVYIGMILSVSRYAREAKIARERAKNATIAETASESVTE